MTQFDADFLDSGDNLDIDEDIDFDPEFDFEGEWKCMCGYKNVGVLWCEVCGREIDKSEEEHA